MRWIKTEEGYFQSEKGTLKINCGTNKKWDNWLKGRMETKNLSPLERMQREWDKVKQKERKGR